VKRFNIALARREKIMVSIGAGCLGLFLLFYFLIFPLLSSKARLRRAIEADQKRLEELTALSNEYKTLQGNSGDIGKEMTGRKKDFTLFSLLEKLASQAGLKDRIKYIKPSTSQPQGNYVISSVEMQLEAITMQQLFDYLYRVEDPQHVITIKRLSISNHKEKPGYVDATLQVSTIQLA
jgi:general secretion pathway protein M